MLLKNQFLFGLGALIAGVAAAPATMLSTRAPPGAQEDACEKGNFGSSFADGVPWNINLPNSKYFCATQHDSGRMISGMTVWRDKWSMTGIQLIYEDKTTSEVFGKRNSEGQTFEWGSEAMGSLWTFRNDKGDSVGGIDGDAAGKLLTFKHFDMKNKNKGTKNDIYSGVLLAVRGRYSDVTLNTIEFRFMESKPIKVETVKFEIDEGEYAQAIAEKKGIEQVSLKTFWIENPNKDNATYWFENVEEKERGSSTTSTTTHAYAMKITLSAKLTVGVPEVAATEGGISIENGYTYTKTNTNEVNNKSKTGVTYKVVAAIPGGQVARCEAKAWTGKYKGSFTSVNRVYMASGKSFDLTQKGEIESISWTEGFGSCKNYPREEVPQGVLINHPTFSPAKPNPAGGPAPFGQNGVLVPTKNLGGVFAPEDETPIPEGETPPAPEGETPAPAPEGETPPAPEGETPAPAPEGETPAPAPEGETQPPAPEGETPAPAPEGETPAPAPQGETPAPAPQGETQPPAPEGEVVQRRQTREVELSTATARVSNGHGGYDEVRVIKKLIIYPNGEERILNEIQKTR